MIHNATDMLANTASFIKAKTMGSFLLVITGFFLPVFELREALISLFLLVIFDFITGMYASYKTGKHIKSAGIYRTAVKITFYFVLVSAAFHAENTVPIGFIDDSVIAFLAVTELISVLENTAKAGFAIPKKLMAKLQNFSNKL